jgi:lipopolysaccharide/colanic/teichoic acid biosynthesis glycosyltransferase
MLPNQLVNGRLPLLASPLTYAAQAAKETVRSPLRGSRTNPSPGQLAPGLDRPIAGSHADSWSISVQRVLDFLVGGTGILLAAPIMAFVALWIRLDSPGPIVFRQRRVGLGGYTFTFYKFRTMHVDARDRFPELYDYDYTDEQWKALVFKLPDDPRLTRAGRILRRTTLDELPNLFNLMRGDVSLVGPRPELPDFVRYYSHDQLAKFSVKPGLTGLAQVTGRAMLSVQATIAADLEYIARKSIWLDLHVIARTLAMVLSRVGAY